MSRSKYQTDNVVPPVRVTVTVLISVGLLLTAGSTVLAFQPHPVHSPPSTQVIEFRNRAAALYSSSPWARRALDRRTRSEEAIACGEEYAAETFSATTPVIVGNFADLNHDFSVAEYQELLFESNPTGSLTEYFQEVSYGQFDLSGTVYGPFTAHQDMAYYGSNDNGLTFDFPQNAAGFIWSVLEEADISVDFSQYDNDGPDNLPNSGDDDGYVDVLTVICAGGKYQTDNLWPHSSALNMSSGAAFVTDDARSGGGSILIDSYTIQTSENGDGTLDEFHGIGVFAHEYAHLLGLPDLYDWDNSSYGVGSWCLMGWGAFGAENEFTSGNRPTHLSAWCKIRLGWVTPIEVSGTQTVTIPPVATSGVVYKLWEDAFKAGRYFLLENRVRTGFDSDIKGEGVLIWHCNDESASANYDDALRLVDLEEADGADELDSKTSLMDAGDVYPGVTANTCFADTTYPSAESVYGHPTGVHAEGFAYVSGPGSDVTVTLTAREIRGYVLSVVPRNAEIIWPMKELSVHHFAVRYSTPTDGILIGAAAPQRAGSTNRYRIRVMDEIGCGPQGVHSETAGSFPGLESGTYCGIPLASTLALTEGQTFVLDLARGPDVYGAAMALTHPPSGQSFSSYDGANYYPLAAAGLDIALEAKIHTGCTGACVDDDGDGICLYLDNCPYENNPEQTNNDDDALGDACDDDDDNDLVVDADDNCRTIFNPYQEDIDSDGVGDLCDNCLDVYNPDQADANGNDLGNACDPVCCAGRVGDANGIGGDEPTISDVSIMIDAKFITGTCDGVLECLTEADVNFSGWNEPDCDDITIGDISNLIDYLFITGPSAGLGNCL